LGIVVWRKIEKPFVTCLKTKDHTATPNSYRMPLKANQMGMGFELAATLYYGMVYTMNGNVAL
jgi:hypothetical protein